MLENCSLKGVTWHFSGRRYSPLHHLTSDLSSHQKYTTLPTPSVLKSGLTPLSFSSVWFLWKIIELPGGQINYVREILFSLAATSHVSRSQPCRAFLSWLGDLQGPPTSPCALRPESQCYKHSIRCATLAMEVQGQYQEQLTQTSIVCLFKSGF